MCWWVISPLVIFAVLDVSLVVNVCINCSFLKYIFISIALSCTVFELFDVE